MTDRLEKMLDSGRDDAMLRFGLGSAYFSEDNYELAVEHLEQCLVHDDQYAAAYKLLGKALFKLQRFDRAQTILSRGLPVAIAKGDKQSQKEIEAFLAKTQKALGVAGEGEQ